MGFTRTAAGKTGTTNDYADAWFVGYTPELLAVVWVGFDHRRSLHLTGGEAALPIWTAFMKRATAALPLTPFVPPPGITLARIDPESGLLATDRCPQAIVEAFYKDTAPSRSCPLHPLEEQAPSDVPAPQAKWVAPTRLTGTLTARTPPRHLPGTLGRTAQEITPPLPNHHAAGLDKEAQFSVRRRS
jgi:membrane carboxypeptidase/penicillin-binding protein